MATFVNAPTYIQGYPRTAARTVSLSTPTTYFFRRANGTRGNATDLASIPVGAVVERSAQ